MSKNIFFNKKYNSIYLFSIYIFIFLLAIYSLFFYYLTNKDYFIIPEYGLDFYSIPEDKKGEKIKYLDKKSLNNFNNINLDKSNIDKVKYTIQLFSDVDINNVYKFLSNLKTIKKELIISDELFLFSFQTEIGSDYFLSYKNFETKNNAIKACKLLSFVKKCIIINLQNL